LDRRIADRSTRAHEAEAWTRGRNETEAAITWMFGIAQARQKLGYAYPTPATATQEHAA
jgi:hypothetical protein